LRFGPELRHGIADLTAKGEVVGGVVIMRRGYDSRSTIEAVKAALADHRRKPAAACRWCHLRPIAARRSVVIGTLQRRLLEEMVLVLLVFLGVSASRALRRRALVTLPLGMLGASRSCAPRDFRRMHVPRGSPSHRTMIDAAIVMGRETCIAGSQSTNPFGHARRVDRPCVRGRSDRRLFVSLLIVALSFVPLLVL